MPAPSRQHWRITWAVTRGRTAALDSEDRDLALRWAEAAVPLLLTQLVLQTSTLLVVLLGQAVPFALEPQSGVRVWMVSATALLFVAGVVFMTRQYVAVRRLVRASRPHTHSPS